MTPPKHRLFHTIAPVYGLFFQWQKKMFRQMLAETRPTLDLLDQGTVLDVGCGTGALCAVLHEKGVSVTGVEPAIGMLRIARRKNRDSGIPFLQADAIRGLPFPDGHFDVAFASYVAHGLASADRIALYREMQRVAKRFVIIHDYSGNRAILTTIIETLEGGDYFKFIKRAENEMHHCRTPAGPCFKNVTVIRFGKRAAWYIGTLD